MEQRGLRPDRLDVLPNAPTASRVYKHWLFVFTQYKATFSAETTDATFFGLLANSLSAENFEIISQCSTFQAAMTALNSVFDKIPNEITARVKLATRRQLSRESVDEYLRTPIEFDEPLLDAIYEKLYDQCVELLSSGADANIKHEKLGVRALQVAVKVNSDEITKLLLQNGANINLPDGEGSCAIHTAIINQSKECITTLLGQLSIDLKVKDAEERLPIHLAAILGDEETMSALIVNRDANLEINYKDAGGCTPLHLAAAGNHSRIVSLLIDKSADVNIVDNKGYYPIHVAALNGHETCCRILLEKGGEEMGEVIVKGRGKATPLILAAKMGHLECCKLFMRFGINTQDSQGKTALHYASGHSSFTDIVSELVSNDANPYVKDKHLKTPIHLAAFLSRSTSLMILTRSRNNPGLTKTRKNILHIAVHNERLENVSYILRCEEFHCLIDEQDQKGRTPLHIAASNSNIEICRLLLNCGASVNILDVESNLAIHLAAYKSAFSICESLIQENPDSLLKRNKNGATPLLILSGINADCTEEAENCLKAISKTGYLISLKGASNVPFHLMALSGNEGFLKYLAKENRISFKIVTDFTEDSALHLAAIAGHLGCCQILLKHCPSLVDFQNKYRRSALEEAFLNKNDDIFDLLLRFLDKDKRVSEKKFIFLQLLLHSILKDALKDHRKIIVKSVVNSPYWYSSVSQDFCPEEKCTNFFFLIKDFPDLSKIIFGKCVTRGNTTSYNLALFENAFQIPKVTSIKDVDKKMLKYPKHSTFTVDTFTPRSHVEEINNYINTSDHPLAAAIENEDQNLLFDELTEKYIDAKEACYIVPIFIGFLIFEALFLLTLSINIGFSWNYAHLNITNQTRETMCRELQYTPEISEGHVTRIVLGICLCIFFVCFVFLEGYQFRKVQFKQSLEIIFRLARLLGILLYGLWLNTCSFDLGIKQTWQWQIGILTLIHCWFFYIHLINNLPMLSISMPITRKFFLSFLKIALYVSLIIFFFCYVFHLLLLNQKVFSTIPFSFMKTIAWLHTDLGYDDIFVNSEVNYPIMTNLIFIFFVATVSLFISNLVVTHWSSFDEFKEKAALRARIRRLKLVLKIDTFLVCFRKRFTTNKWPCATSPWRIFLNGVKNESLDKCRNKYIKPPIGAIPNDAIPINALRIF